MFIKLIMEKLMLKQQKEKKLKENHSIVSMIMAYLNVILFIFICIWRYLNKKEESSY
jgi:heme/copper-type cytochrome/quinol oxidase subunit 2